MNSRTVKRSTPRVVLYTFVTPVVVFLCACSVNSPLVAPPPLPRGETTAKPTYTWLNENVFRRICIYCHSERKPNLHHYDSIQSVVIPGKPLDSRLYFMVATNRMPKGGRLSDEKKWAIYQWILNGAKED